MARQSRTRREQIARVTIVLVLLGLLLPSLLPELAPTIDEEAAHTAVQWLGDTFSYRQILLSPIAVLLIIALIKTCRRFILLHKQSDDSTSPQINTHNPDKPSDTNLEQQHHTMLLKNLSGDEKTLLKKRIDADKKCSEYSMSDSTALGLHHNDILRLPEQVPKPYPRWSSPIATYCVSPWAWELLKQNPDWLKLPEESENQNRLDLIRNLSGAAKNLLDMARINDTDRVDVVGPERPIAQAMVTQGILYHPEGHVRDFFIEPRIWKLINQHPELLQ